MADRPAIPFTAASPLRCVLAAYYTDRSCAELRGSVALGEITAVEPGQFWLKDPCAAQHRAASQRQRT